MILFAALVATAAACGGFFCSRAQPVVQAGENILFSMDGLEITATIQIQYSGEASKFSWVLPLPSDPTSFGVSSDRLFRALHQFTAPRFSMTVENPSNCSTWAKTTMTCLFFSTSRALASASASVNVVAMGEVGPYEYTVITALASDPMGDALFSWLNANGFDQPPSSKPIVARYVGLKHRFVTLKLQKGKSSGELVPIVLKYKSPLSTAMSCVPLRLTAIAATDEMPVFVWIAGKERAVPQNFVHIKPDFAALPWEQCAFTNNGGWQGGFIGGAGLFRPFGVGSACDSQYKTLLKQTAAEFGAGKWLTTEFAGKRPDGLLENVWSIQNPPVNVANLASQTDPLSFIQQLLGTLPTDVRASPLVMQLMRKHIPMPQDVDANCMSESVFYSTFSNRCLSKYAKNFDSKAFAADVQAQLLQPIIDGRNQLEKSSYITRLYTLMTPANMVRDPVFRFVEGADDVSNIHTAKFTIECPAALGEAATGTIIVDNSTELARKVNGITEGSCGSYEISAQNVSIGDAVIELLQEDDKAPKKLKRTPLINFAAVQTQDALLNDIDGSIIGTPITASCGNCNCGSLGCGCMAGNMCMKGAVCETSSIGVKTCVAAPTATSTLTLTLSAANKGVELTFALAALALALPALC